VLSKALSNSEVDETAATEGEAPAAGSEDVMMPMCWSFEAVPIHEHPIRE
jgi:hypothetical protein